MRRENSFLTLLIALSVLSFVCCSPPPVSTSQTPTRTPSAVIRVAVVPPAFTSPFHVSIKEGATSAAAGHPDVAAGTGARVELRHLEDGRFRGALRRLLATKEELAPGSEGLFGAFAPGPDGGEAPRRIDYAAIGRGVSPHDAILLCAGADPRSGNDLDALEAEVRARLEACARAFPG